MVDTPISTTNLAAALLRDVPRYDAYDVMMTLDGHPLPGGCAFGKWVRHADVLATLTAAMDPAIAERAGEVLEGVTPEPWTLCRLADQTPYSIQASYGCVNGLSALFTLAHINVPDEAEVGMTDGAFDRETADANARFIAWCREGVPALLAQNAALEPTDAPDLSDPVTVHANMLRGTIAKPTVEQIIHLYGVDTLAKALAPVIVREAAPYMTDLMVDPETIPDMEMEYDHRAGDDSDD